MEPRIILGNPPITVAVRQNARARRMSLRVSGLDGRVSLTVPHGVSEKTMHRFLAERETWLRQHISGVDEAVQVGPGAELPIEGRLRLVVPAPVPRIVLEDARLLIPERLSQPEKGIAPWIKRQARPLLEEASQAYARQLGVGFSRVTLKDTRSRWGSCSSAGNLNYSWRLLLAPRPVLRYVAAHEVAHLVEMNHSPAFWAVVARIYPDWQAQRDWLRSYGNGLHRYRFF